ncbi:MAG: cytidine deaminase, partial [Acidothermus sp.]|nr:cytidine deaminase [Acidothermus sp.]
MTSSSISDAEDAKLLTLARSARARVGAEEGAAVRDETGRTYVGIDVQLPSLRLSALQAAVVVAAASGVRRIEAAAVVGVRDRLDDGERRLVADLNPDARVYLADEAG